MEYKEKLVRSIIFGSICAIVAVVFLTIFADLNPPLKKWLTSTFGHHWIGKSVISVLVFVVSSVFFRVFNLKSDLKVLIWTLVLISNLSFLILFGFFIIETF